MSNPKLPTELKRARGTLRPCRENPNAPDLPLELPEPPAGDFRPELLAEFDRLAEILFAAGTATRADSFAILGCAQAILDHRDACSVIASQGTYVETAGGLKVHPAVRVRNDADKRARAWMQSLGLTPSDRAKVSAAPAPREKSGLAKLLEMPT